MKPLRVFYTIFVIIFLFANFAQADGYNISGRILKPDGTPAMPSSASFALEVTDSLGTCVLYSEQINGVDMRGGNGNFHVVLGTGTRQFPTDATPLESVFLNDTAFGCKGGATYTPTPFEERRLKISFHDGVAWQFFGDQPLKSVPLSTRSKTAESANSAKSLGNYLPTHFLRTNVNIRELSPAEATNLIDLAGGTSSSYVKTESDPTVKPFAKTALPVCSTGQVLKADGASFSCVPALTTNPLPVGTTGQVLKHNGTDWTADFIYISDVQNLAPQLSEKISKSQLPASCGTNQTLGYVSVSDNWSCYPINLTFGGDISGTQNAVFVHSIRNIPVASNFPVTGQVLKFDGATWRPSADLNSGGTVTNVSSASPFITVTNNGTTPVISANVGTVANTLAAGDDMRFSDARTPAGLAGGDLSGNYPNPTVMKIQGVPVDVSSGFQDGDTLVYSAGLNKWTLKRTGGCDPGWMKVLKGAPYCIKQPDTVLRTLPQALIACENIGGDLCSTTQVIHACRDGNKVTATDIVWSNHVFSSTASSILCNAGGAYSVSDEAIGTLRSAYCCKPVN